ncbi:BamA/TamA family outer membrane protein [Flavobacterium hiemivividum]|uniref:Bacterial surface antigen (D15) domain-containing protein n=1 Tax=Flavobacterium hiemivividum TaxID=2541734 RepID=A0A4R5CVM2_9FLAO|nr:hypothetical protein [Flavobacterium hiemivividum]TDE04496.1 hypothetical protein E0F98_07535 [Flavobacterium hiemivividum]
MKNFLIYISLLAYTATCYSQNFKLQLTGISRQETQTIDSLNYISKHKNALSIKSELETTSQRLSQLGFIENKITNQLKENDSTYTTQISLGIKIKHIHINIGTNNAFTKTLFNNTTQDSIFIPYLEIEKFLNQNTIALERKGFPLAKLKLTNIQRKENILFANLQFETENQRQLNTIVIKQTDNPTKNSFPSNYLTQINRKYKNKTFNQELLTKIHEEFRKISFVSQPKQPEILFTKDSTKVYVYLEKRKSNTFDGFLGFSNNENKKIVLNGYLDLTLENTLKVGEQFSLYWKSDGDQQKTFNTSLELPYLFKTPIGLKAQLNIFKQDSTYQNTKTQIDLSYFINYNTRFYLGYQSTASSDIQNTNSTTLADYNNTFITSKLNFSQFDYSKTLFLKKSSLDITAGSGKRETNNQSELNTKYKQFFIELQAMHTFYLNTKNNINIKSYNYFLYSSNYLDNELYRFGGINSIRGFSENSLQANLMTTIITEYRYIISPSVYFNTILDYCSFRSPSSIKNKTDLLGFGLGFGVQTANGLLKISLANGSEKSTKIDFYNTIIHISYNVKF